MSFDALYVVSDLHLGGPPGFQIFRQGELLAAAIDHIAGLAVGQRVGLVLNGDIVDFLAEEDPQYLKLAGAARSLRRIAQDDAFKAVFEALARFLDTGDRTLVLVLGNHDVELALPEVRAALDEILCEGDPARRGRLVLAFDGTGYRCTVGGRAVYCFHGEQADPWNVVDHGALRKVVRALNQGVEPPSWTPNGGTRMVIDAMNLVKLKYPVIDLLKPETRAAIPVVYSFDPSQARALGRVVAALRQKLWDTVRGRFLSAEERDEALELDGWVASDVASPAWAEQDLLRAAVDHRDGDPLDLLPEAEREESLGLFGAARNIVTGGAAAETVRQILQTLLKGDRTFDLDTPDEPSTWADRHLGSGLDFVVAGHTHLRRARMLHQGTTAYFNSGTWISLVGLSEDDVADQAAFEVRYEQLKGPTLDHLARDGLLRHEPTVVAITADAGRVSGRLCEARADGAGTVVLHPLAGSELVP